MWRHIWDSPELGQSQLLTWENWLRNKFGTTLKNKMYKIWSILIRYNFEAVVICYKHITATFYYRITAVSPNNNLLRLAKIWWENWASRKVKGQLFKKIIWIWSSIFLRVWGHFEKGLVQVGECDHCERGKCYLQMMVALRGRFSWQLSNQYTLHPKHHLYTLYFILYTFHFTPIQSIHFTLFTLHFSLSINPIKLLAMSAFIAGSCDFTASQSKVPHWTSCTGCLVCQLPAYLERVQPMQWTS